MSIKQVNTEFLIEEMTTDGHAPMKFLCDDQEVYFCKYRLGLDRNEIDCLAYEIIASTLLQELAIPTPEIAIVKISENTLNKKIIKKNRHVRVGDYCFGSKSIEPSAVLNEITSLLNSKRDFNRIVNPEDIVRISIFDLWVENSDRGRCFGSGFNYNLLLSELNNKIEITAFDHGFIFGGQSNLRVFNSRLSIDTSNKLHNTTYYKSITKFIEKERYQQIVEEFVPLLSKDYGHIITNIISELPKAWDLGPNLGHRITTFLSDKNRIQNIKEIILANKS